MDYIAAGVLTGMSGLTLGYAVLLESLHDYYTPNHVWATVAGGFAIIGAGLWVWLWLDPLPSSQQFAAFWRFVFLTCTAGSPIIAWQIGQSRARRSLRLWNAASSVQGKGGSSDSGSGSGGPYDEDTRRA